MLLRYHIYCCPFFNLLSVIFEHVVYTVFVLIECIDLPCPAYSIRFVFFAAKCAATVMQMWLISYPPAFLSHLLRSLVKSLFVIVLLYTSMISRAAVEFPAETMSTISPTDFDSVEIQQQYNDINNRWDLTAETEWDNENSSARLFERSRIKALAGQFNFLCMCESRFCFCTHELPVCVFVC